MKTSNRAAQKSGKKTVSAQAPGNTETATGETAASQPQNSLPELPFVLTGAIVQVYNVIDVHAAESPLTTGQVGALLPSFGFTGTPESIEAILDLLDRLDLVWFVQGGWKLPEKPAVEIAAGQLKKPEPHYLEQSEASEESTLKERAAIWPAEHKLDVANELVKLAGWLRSEASAEERHGLLGKPFLRPRFDSWN